MSHNQLADLKRLDAAVSEAFKIMHQQNRARLAACKLTSYCVAQEQFQDANTNLVREKGMLDWLTDLIETLNPEDERFSGDPHPTDEEVYAAIRRYYVLRESWKVHR